MLTDNFQEFDKDGIHPTDKGYKIIAEHLRKQLERQSDSNGK